MRNPPIGRLENSQGRMRENSLHSQSAAAHDHIAKSRPLIFEIVAAYCPVNTIYFLFYACHVGVGPAPCSRDT